MESNIKDQEEKMSEQLKQLNQSDPEKTKKLNDMVTQLTAMSINTAGVSFFTEVLIDMSKTKEALLINAARTYDILKPQLTDERKKEYLLFIQTVAESMSKEIGNV